MFGNPQEFYEHLDECVLRSLEQEEPSEMINAQRLAEVDGDGLLLETMDRHSLPQQNTQPLQAESTFDDEDDGDNAEDEKETGNDEVWTGIDSQSGRARRRSSHSNTPDSS